MTALLLVAALTIIVGLASYAFYLSVQVKKAKQEVEKNTAEAEQKIRDHQHQMINDIRFVARSVTSEQCDITEGVLRLHYLVKALDNELWEHYQLTGIRSFYAEVADMPILEAYQALSKQQQFELDNVRYQLEQQHKAAIFNEMRWLTQFNFPSITLIH